MWRSWVSSSRLQESKRQHIYTLKTDSFSLMFETEDSSPILVYEDCGFLPNLTRIWEEACIKLGRQLLSRPFFETKIPICWIIGFLQNLKQSERRYVDTMKADSFSFMLETDHSSLKIVNFFSNLQESERRRVYTLQTDSLSSMLETDDSSLRRW